MDFLKSLFLLFALFSCSVYSSQGYKFYVGESDGWVVNPRESYNQWAERNRFQVNDTLYFKYKTGSDSVLLVNKDDYYNCSTKDPLKKMEGGDSEFKFDSSGPFYFISGNTDQCKKGKKLIVVVLQVRPPPPSHAPPQLPPPPSQPPIVAESPKSPSTTLPPKPTPPSTTQPPKGSSPTPAPSPPTPPTSGSNPPESSSPPQSPAANPPKAYSPSQSPVANSPKASSPSPATSTESQAPSPMKSSAVATSSSLMVVGISVGLGWVLSSFVGVI